MCDPVSATVAVVSLASAADQHSEQNRAQDNAANEQKVAFARADEEKKRIEEEKKRIGPAPTKLEASTDLTSRARRLSALRSGVLSTVRTSPMGTMGDASVSAPGLKAKLGQ